MQPRSPEHLSRFVRAARLCCWICSHDALKRIPKTGGTSMNLKTITQAAVIIAGAVAGMTAAAQQPIKIDFTNETVGGEPKTLLPVVGVWRIENERGNNVLAVDGRQWKEGQSSAGIADKAKALYGERYAEFLDRVQAFAYYPYAVVKDVDDFKNGENQHAV